MCFSLQITELKRGTEVVVCTPGRMIDILVTSAGKITNLRRVTYLVCRTAARRTVSPVEHQESSCSLQCCNTLFPSSSADLLHIS
jgi:superfamily II DNA/RNA helicase